MMRLAILALVVLVSAGCQAGSANPYQIAGAIQQVTQSAGDLRGAFVDMDEPEEVELGRSVTALVGSRYPVSRNLALTKYVALVGNSVAATSDRPDLRYHFAVLDSPDINALASPGGYVFVTRGALDLMKDEAALAGVLGHEVGHIALKHHGETIKAQKRKALLVTGAQVGASFTKAAPFTSLIGQTADLIGESVLKGHSREEEMQSDQVGFQYAARAGYDPAALREFLAALKAKSGDAGVQKWNSTHPGLDDRLQEKLLQTHKSGGKRETQRFLVAMGRVQPPQPQAPAQQAPQQRPQQQQRPAPQRPQQQPQR
jgi:beta-barrel assembly-enhancing protease